MAGVASQDYEHVRNLTILFFLEKLVSRGEERTLHDLSCQFGTRGFSKEMRQIAGGSKVGLKKFLSQYPALFSVRDDDAVSLAPITPAADVDPMAGHNSGRDYNREAMGYFKDKLRQYGEGVEVPIRSLLGHRSQAPMEVRHVSGQHVSDFREFLARFPDEFVLSGEVVFLKEFADTERQPYTASPSTAVPSAADAETSARLVAFLRSRLLLFSEAVPLEALFHSAMQHAETTGNSIPIRSGQDLKAFLRMYPLVFRVTGEKVFLNSCSSSSSSLSSPTHVARESSTSPGAAMADNAKISLRDRVTSVIRKVVEDNTQKDRAKNFCLQTELVRSDKVMEKTKLVASREEAESLFRRINSSLKVISVALKGVSNEGNSDLVSMHIGTSDGWAYIIDAIATDGLLQLEIVKTVMESPSIVKVMHDCRIEAALLWRTSGITLQNVFDTQAAHAVLQEQDKIMHVHKAKNIALYNLIKLHNISGDNAIEQLKKVSRRDQKVWLQRPLNSDIVLTSAFDVIVMATGLYSTLTKLIEDKSVPLLGELCEEQVLSYITPDVVKERKRQRRLNLETAEIHDKLLRRPGDKPVVLSNRELRIVRYMQLSEEEKNSIYKSTKTRKVLEGSSEVAIDDEMESSPPSLESVTSDDSPSSSFDDILAADARAAMRHRQPEAKSVHTQTISTGDIVITKIFSQE